MDRDIHLIIRSDPKLLASIRSLVRSWLESWEMDEKTTHDVVLAIDEACTNAIRHAYKGRNDGSVELTLNAAPEYLEFQVSDQGVPCPVERAAKREMEPPDPDQLTPGGLGIQLIYNVFDEVDFCSGEECGNRVTMKLKRSK